MVQPHSRASRAAVGWLGDVGLCCLVRSTVVDRYTNTGVSCYRAHFCCFGNAVNHSLIFMYTYFLLHIYFSMSSTATGRVDRRTWGGGWRWPEAAGVDAPVAVGQLGRQHYRSGPGHGVGQAGAAVSRRKSLRCGRRKAALHNYQYAASGACAPVASAEKPRGAICHARPSAL